VKIDVEGAELFVLQACSARSPEAEAADVEELLRSHRYGERELERTDVNIRQLWTPDG
jgi:hypothetical protein